MLLKVQIDRSQSQYFISTEVRHKYGPPAETHAKWKNKLELDFEISKHHLISQRENYRSQTKLIKRKLTMKIACLTFGANCRTVMIVYQLSLGNF